MLANKAKEVLKTLDQAALLQHLVLIGSWCGHFYITYFGKRHFRPTIQTLDIDFLVPEPRRLHAKTASVEDLLKPLDFETEYTRSGWLRFVHPELRVEFLVPRLGPTPGDPRKIPQLKITAMPLRHMSPLTTHTIHVAEDGMQVRLPHPGAFALHKLFVSARCQDSGKKARDREMALRILEAIQKTDTTNDLTPIWPSFTKKERETILQVLRGDDQEKIYQLLTGIN